MRSWTVNKLFEQRTRKKNNIGMNNKQRTMNEFEAVIIEAIWWFWLLLIECWLINSFGLKKNRSFKKKKTEPIALGHTYTGTETKHHDSFIFSPLSESDNDKGQGQCQRLDFDATCQYITLRSFACAHRISSGYLLCSVHFFFLSLSLFA